MSDLLKDNEALIATPDIPEFLGRSITYVRKLIKDKGINPVGIEDRKKYYLKDELRYAAYLEC